MAPEMDGWDRAGLLRLIEALSEEADGDDAEPGGVLMEVSGVDATAQSRAYDEAVERAITAALGNRTRHRKEKRSRDRVIAALSQPPPPYGAFKTWRSGGWPLVDALLKVSFEHRYSNPQAMRSLASMAHSVACGTDPESYPLGVVFDLRARAAAELANAERMLDQFEQAEMLLRDARVWQAMGSGDAALLARLDDVEASLRLEQRRFPKALGLLEQAHGLYLEINERHLAGRTLISRARVVYNGGDPAEAARLLEEGMALLDRERDPRLVFTTIQSLLLALTDCGEYRRAGELLLESGLGEAFADEPLNLLRLRWVEAKIHAGLDRLERAEAIFTEIRAGFREHGLEFDAALAGLDLTKVWLRQGQADRVLPLAVEMIRTFDRMNLPKEGIMALAFLKVACEMEVLTVPVVDRTREFIVRLQANPDLKFEVVETLLG